MPTPLVCHFGQDSRREIFTFFWPLSWWEGCFSCWVDGEADRLLRPVMKPLPPPPLPPFPYPSPSPSPSSSLSFSLIFPEVLTDTSPSYLHPFFSPSPLPSPHSLLLTYPADPSSRVSGALSVARTQESSPDQSQEWARGCDNLGNAGLETTQPF